MDLPDRIHLRDHVIEAEIGAFQSERGQTQRLRFHITVDLAAPVVGAGDDVDRILSYDVLTDAIAAGLADERFNLLETLAERIAAEILTHAAAGRVEVTIEKLDRVPGALGVTISRRRGRVQTGAEAAAPVVLFYAAPVALPGGPVILVPDAPDLPLPQGGDARRVALLALDQAAWVLGGKLGLDVVDSRTELDWAAKEGRAVVWAPARMAGDAPEAGEAPDALALWLALRLGAARLDLALPAGRGMAEGLRGAGVPVRQVAP
ncbi:MAG: dihydroneopterin aldolase [Paracoccus sp. (in: a-proteobacteria)]|nr:dihydroneopterin aldolase [Paracoccus sp. (in: a-proteobacteria)]